MNTINKILISIGLLTLTGTGLLQAQTIMLDFGPTAITYPDTAPYVSDGGNTWTRTFIDQWDAPGTAIDTVTVGALTLNIGLGTISEINFYGSKSLRSAGLGGGASSALFGAGTPNIDAIFTADNSNPALGIQIQGLQVGHYEIYITGQNTNSYGSQNFYLSTTAQWQDNSNIAYTSWSSQSVINNTASTWVVGSNYVTFSFDINSNSDILSLVALGTGGDTRGFINALQIVQIPEPSTWVLLLTGGTLTLLGLRRRKPRLH
jgi:hypothetical protein